jgi:hypothetical protein
MKRMKEKRVSISLPSLRIDSVLKESLEETQQVRKTSLTFAPEAGTQRMRDVINKGVTEEDLLEKVRDAFEGGWSSVKLYFMSGLPTETTEDLDGPTDPDNIVGSYVLVEMNGQTLEEMIADAAADSGMTVDAFRDAMKEVGMDFENLIVLEIHEDGTCKMTSMADDSEEGTWSLDGDQVTITFDGDDATGTFADGKISLSEEDTTMVFAKR